MRLLILLIAASSILASSCTIQKRTFRNGYYISWNKPMKEKLPENGTVEKEASEEIRVSESIFQSDTLFLKNNNSIPEMVHETVIESADSVDDEVTNPQISEELKTPSEEIKEEKVSIQKETKHVEKSDEDPQPDLVAFGAFGLSLIYLGFAIIHILSGFGPLISAAVLIACLIGIVGLSIWSIIRKKRNPEKYKGTVFAIIALGILVLSTLAMYAFLFFVFV